MISRIGLAVAILTCAVLAGQAQATIYANLADDYDWPNNPADNASGQWYYYKVTASGRTLLSNTDTADYFADGFYAGLPTAPWTYKFDATHLAALPWNNDGSENDERQVQLVWQSGVSGAVNISGEFVFLGGSQQSAVSILNIDTAVELLAETTLTTASPSVTFNINTVVAVDDEISFIIGTGIVEYDSETETKLSATIIPEPATIALLAVGGTAILRRRKT